MADHCGHIDRPCGCPNAPSPEQVEVARRARLKEADEALLDDSDIESE